MKKSADQAADRHQVIGHGIAGALGLRRVLGIFLFLALLHFPARLHATTANVELAWNPNPETDIATYQLSYGTVSGDHPNVINAGAATATTVTGLVEGTTYYFVVTACNQTGLASAPSTEIIYQIPVTPVNTVTAIPRAGWALHYVDSQASGAYLAMNAIDGNPATMWATNYLDPATMPPHEIQIDLGAVYPVAGFRYLPRQDKYNVGNIGNYEYYVSTDGTQWGSPVATGSFPDVKTEQEVQFSTKSGRYVRLRVLTEVSGDLNCAVAELNVLQGPATITPTARSFADWTTAASLTAANKEPLAIPHHDGVPNMLKYAFAMNANTPDSRVITPGTGTAGLPNIARTRSGNTTALRFEYVRRKNSTLIYTPRKSSNLKTWLPLSTSTPVSVTDVDTEWERVVIAEPCDPNSPAIFGRVEVVGTTL